MAFTQNILPGYEVFIIERSSAAKGIVRFDHHREAGVERGVVEGKLVYFGGREAGVEPFLSHKPDETEIFKPRKRHIAYSRNAVRKSNLSEVEDA